MRLLLCDHELRVSPLGMHRIGGDDAPGQVQGLQQGRELGDLVRLAVNASLGEHGTGALIEGSQQMHGLPVTAGMPGSRTALPSTATARRRPCSRPWCYASFLMNTERRSRCICAHWLDLAEIPRRCSR